ncbi:MAG TPA: tetratricopeptide repeat protein [Terriglobia bacterium]|nr:tetratricopeptide repeat protein [Terriglobia bacterium]
MGKYFGAALLASMMFGSTAVARAGQAQTQDQSQKPAQGPAGSQAGAASQPAQAAPAPPSPDQVKAFNAIQSELDPARQVQLVDDFAKKYPTSELLSDAYFFGAYASQQQGKVPQVIEYGTKSLQANPNNLRSLLTLATMLPQPQDLQGSDADKEKKLGDAEADANKALEIIPTLKQPPSQTPEQFAQVKAGLTSQVHASLGMVHLQRAMEGLTGADPAELAKAEQEYKAAVTGTKQPNPEDYFRLGEVYENEKKIDEAIDAFSQASKLGQGTPIQSYADQQVDKLKKQKAEAPPPAKP